jgi:Protein of unknown function (DUF4232)
VLAGAACAGAASAQTDGSIQGTGSNPACRAAELKALFRGFQAAGGSLTGAVVLVNTGRGPCWLAGTPPTVTLLNDDGDSAPVKSRPLALPADAGLVELAPGADLPAFGAPPTKGSAWFLVTWSNWCADAGPSVHSLLVVLPAGGSVSAPLDAAVPSWGMSGMAAPRCDDGRAGSTVTIGRFQTPAG